MANVIMIDYFNPFVQKRGGAFVSASGLDSYPRYKDNVRFYQDSPTGREVIVSPLVEDFQLHIETSFQKPSQMIPSSFQRIANYMKLFQTAGGQTSRGPNILDILDVPVWDKTEPAKFDLKLQFFLEDDAYTDVVRPAVGLCSLSMLSPNLTGGVEGGGQGATSFLLPGINFANLSETLRKLNNRNQGEGKSVGSKSNEVSFNKIEYSKLIAIEIPGVVYLPIAMIEKADPTFSKEIVDSGFPLWSEVTISIIGLRSANTDMFVPGVNAGMAESLNSAARNYLNDVSGATSALAGAFSV